jgi:dethiobiotin synthetase
MTTLFVTASGTGVGKTFVTTRLIAELRAAGRTVHALKPVASGFDEEHPEDSDSGALLRALARPCSAANLAAISPWRFAAPLSPDMAAAREQRTIPFPALLDFCRAPAAADVTLIEGIGGVMVPLDAEHTVLDWIAALRAPALLVVGSYLGTLSHTLTAAAVLRERGCALAAVIVSESSEQPVALAETAAAIARFLPVAIAALPRALPRAAERAEPSLLPLLARFLG